jgi:hypothetical protein
MSARYASRSMMGQPTTTMVRSSFVATAAKPRPGRM